MFGFFKKKQDPVNGTNNILIKTREENAKDFAVLLVLDGFGIHPDTLGNAVIKANTPFLDTIWSKGFSTLINASGTYVGLPPSEPGNSEVGHLNLGTGRVVQQSLPRINEAMNKGTFQKLPKLVKSFEYARQNGNMYHIMGILSAGGVHGHIKHLFNMLEICKKQKIDPFIHVILDGRDTGLTDGYYYVSKLIEKIKKLGIGRLASISGRFYSMDRDTRWERTQLAYECMVGHGKRQASDVFKLLQDAYKQGENDQVFVPTTLVDKSGNPVGPIKSNDILFFYNYREDRARQITKAFVLDKFDHFERIDFPRNLYFVTMTGYEDDLETQILFPPRKISETMANTVSDRGLKQLHISETEKYAHVTYFFNGGIEDEHKGEKFYQIPSPKVFDYSKVPDMSNSVITDQVLYELNNLEDNNYSLFVINFANPDMVGHTGNLEATIKAVESADQHVEKICRKVIETGGGLVVVGDHGNCETMIDRVTHKVDTAHTNNPVPFIYVKSQDELNASPGDKIQKVGFGDWAKDATGILADVTPSVLGVLGIDKPAAMTGLDLINSL
ncbi:2,3-bisphosphoglycerate-independent phosphoglycerate mutase [Candidatus Dojkabacteria bacterium]|nr:2,3-bisphosphoglycerate-independent phosphoglycerate mutase [Candidatus Dojkabacteria bacterium]